MNHKKKKRIFIVSLLLIDILALFVYAEIFFVISSSLLLIWAGRDLERCELLLLSCFDVILIMAVLIDDGKFQFWNQVYELLDENTNLIYWFRTGHWHAIRLFVAYPGYLISCVGKIGLDQGFTIYIGIIFELLYLYILRILKIYVKEIWTSGLVTGGALIVLFFIMNGRLVFAFLGLQLIIYGQVCSFNNIQKNKWMEWGRIGIGLVLTTVSSGTMLLTVAYVCLIFIIRYLYLISKLEKVKVAHLFLCMCILAIPVWIKVVEYILNMINKNIIYYGGGIEAVVKMLQHGMGKLIFISDSRFYFAYFVILAGVLFINVLLLWQLVIKKYWELLPLYLAVNLGVYGFAVGLSTGIMLLLPLMLAILIKANKITV